MSAATDSTNILANLNLRVN